MSVIKTQAVVEGHTQSDQRRFIAAVLAYLTKSHRTIHIPAAGQFALVTAALKAGYAPENIVASDCNLYSDLIGQLLHEDNPAAEYELCKADEKLWDSYAKKNGSNLLHRAAFVLWVMKRSELERADHFAAMLDDLEENMVEHVTRLHANVVKTIEPLMGVRYEHRSVRQVVEDETLDAETAVIVAEPLMNGKATKGYDYRDHISYVSVADGAPWAREFPLLFEASKHTAPVFLWYHAANMASYDANEVIYAKEYRPPKAEFWLCTHPEMFDDFESFGSVARYRGQTFGAYPLPMWGADDELSPESKVEFVVVNQNISLYYRDLWAHRLGATAGDRYFLVIIDRKIFATVVMQLSEFTRLTNDYVFEQSGFNAPSRQYKRFNRLLMWLLTCEQFGEDVMQQCFSSNRIQSPIGLETTCISKYRKMKGNNGILEVKFRERYENGMYRLLYHAPFRKERYEDCVARFLKEEEEFAGFGNES